MSGNPELTAKEKLQAMLAEYNGLRAESINRNNNIFQLIAVAAVLFGLAVQRDALDGAFWSTVAVGVIACSLLGWRTHRDVHRAATRMQEIEAAINVMFGEDVMVWESLWGGAARGYAKRRPPLTPRGSLRE